MERVTSPSGPGTVVLDLGADIGAAVVLAPARFDGCEIEIRRVGQPWDGRHASVRARHLGAGELHAAVFESLERGCWEARLRGAPGVAPACGFDVHGGRVTHAHLAD
jgi:hypothetical protein